MAKFISALPGKKPEINLLPYHNIAANKYTKMGLTYQEFDMAEPSEEEQAQALSIFEKYGLFAEIGG